MAYYDTLIAAWNNPTQPPPGVVGTGLNPAWSTSQKVTTINGWKVAPAAQPMLIPTYKLYNCLVAAEWAALTDVQRQNVRDIFMLGTTDGSVGTATRSTLLSTFGAATQTRANLITLTTQFDTPSNVDWCSVNGYPTYGPQGPGNLSTSDAANAGLV
jgi:hypothetical protein